MKCERILDEVNNSAESTFRVVTTKIFISISIPHMILYNKNGYQQNMTLSSVFILLHMLSVDLLGLIIKKKKNS